MQGSCDGDVGDGQVDGVERACEARIQVVDTDDAPWSEWSDADGGYSWREQLIDELLSRDNGATLYVSGTSPIRVGSPLGSTPSSS